MAASDEVELVKMINTSVDINDNPSAIRYPEEQGLDLIYLQLMKRLKLEKERLFKKENKLAF